MNFASQQDSQSHKSKDVKNSSPLKFNAASSINNMNTAQFRDTENKVSPSAPLYKEK